MPQRNLYLHNISIQEAKNNGLSSYFTGHPCKHGHVSIRRVDSGCRACMLIKLSKRTKSHVKKNPYVISKPLIHGPFVDLNLSKRLNLKQYYAYHPCARGHIEPCDTKKQHCIKCKSIMDASYRELNKPKIKESGKKYYSKNIDKIKEYAKTYGKENKGKRNYHTAKRRAKMKLAMPKWYSRKPVDDLYSIAVKNGLHVDHAIPLQSRFVCGLHCIDNLQMLSPEENKTKSNVYWEDMPNTNDQELINMAREFNNEI